MQGAPHFDDTFQLTECPKFTRAIAPPFLSRYVEERENRFIGPYTGKPVCGILLIRLHLEPKASWSILENHEALIRTSHHKPLLVEPREDFETYEFLEPRKSFRAHMASITEQKRYALEDLCRIYRRDQAKTLKRSNL